MRDDRMLLVAYCFIVRRYNSNCIIFCKAQMEESPQKKSEQQTPKIQISESPHKQIDSRWVQLKFSTSFTPRSYFASCIQAGNIYIHGGFNAEAGILKDLLVCCMYELPATWKTLTAKNNKQCNPGPLRNHSLSTYKSNLILLGGQKNVVQNNSLIYRYDLLSNTWSICKCTCEQSNPFNFALDSHSAIVFKSNMYLFGGFDALSTLYSSKVIKISLDRIGQDILSYKVIDCVGGPSPRANSSCCLVDNQVYIFGGGKVEEVYDDYWTFDLETQKWTEITKSHENFVWPEKRKGATLVLHGQSGNLFMFGGIKSITKQCNDVHVWQPPKKRWIKIHSNTNQLYDPSPRVKNELQSPSISDQRRKKEKMKTHQGFGSFKLGIHAVMKSDNFNRTTESNQQFHKKAGSVAKIEGVDTVTDFKRKMSVVQQKKYREFLNRKKKLLSNIQSGYDKSKAKRSHSPTSEAIIFSLNAMGEQPKNQRSDNLPKVIYNEDKGQVIGKKPCARDGHAALVHEDSMIILGGDRHMVSFKDAYIFKLNKGLESLPHYE